MIRHLIAVALLCVPAAAMAQQRTVFDAPVLAITAGGTSQQVFPFNESRKYLLIQNPVGATEPLFCNFGAAASLTLGTSISLAAGSIYQASDPNFIPRDAVFCNATTTAHAFVAKEG